MADCEGRLIMRQQLPIVFGLLLHHKRIVCQIGQFLGRKLAQDWSRTRVLRILAPLWPSLAERRDRQRSQTNKYRRDFQNRIHWSPLLSRSRSQTAGQIKRADKPHHGTRILLRRGGWGKVSP